MTQNKTPSHIKLDERNHIEKTLLLLLNRQGRDIIPLIQDLLTGKNRVTSLLTEPQKAGA
jgi:hypothetical protein